MSGRSWLRGDLFGFDTETTGVEVETDHILTASMINIGCMADGWPMASETLWLDPGVPIPPQSTKIHGITNEQIQAKGEDPAECLEAICMVMAAVVREQVPVVGHNIVYDLTILDRNCRRLGVTPLSDRVQTIWAIDTLVLDKVVDRFRKGTGGRKLENICNIYQVDAGEAHSSHSDALAAARVAYRIGRLYPPVGALDVPTIHAAQGVWKVTQDKNLAAYLKGVGKDPTGLDGSWPLRLPDSIRVREASDDQLQEEPLW